jgi:4a-hydroxytetrahydrobiopterin dehydratase
MEALSASEVSHQLAARPSWKMEKGHLIRQFDFADFAKALEFVNRVGELAEEMAHHPDIEINYNKVRLSLVTHDAGGLTNQDFQLAAAIDNLAPYPQAIAS